MKLVLKEHGKESAMVDAIKEKTGIDFKKKMTVEEALKLARRT